MVQYRQDDKLLYKWIKSPCARGNLIYYRDSLLAEFLIILSELLKCCTGCLAHGHDREVRCYLVYRDQSSWWAGDFRDGDPVPPSLVLNLHTTWHTSNTSADRELRRNKDALAVLHTWHIPDKRPQKLSSALKGCMLTGCTKENDLPIWADNSKCLAQSRTAPGLKILQL